MSDAQVQEQETNSLPQTQQILHSDLPAGYSFSFATTAEDIVAVEAITALCFARAASALGFDVTQAHRTLADTLLARLDAGYPFALTPPAEAREYAHDISLEH